MFDISILWLRVFWETGLHSNTQLMKFGEKKIFKYLQYYLLRVLMFRNSVNLLHQDCVGVGPRHLELQGERVCFQGI